MRQAGVNTFEIQLGSDIHTFEINVFKTLMCLHKKIGTDYHVREFRSLSESCRTVYNFILSLNTISYCISEKHMKKGTRAKTDNPKRKEQQEDSEEEAPCPAEGKVYSSVLRKSRRDKLIKSIALVMRWTATYAAGDKLKRVIAALGDVKLDVDQIVESIEGEVDFAEGATRGEVESSDSEKDCRIEESGIERGSSDSDESSESQSGSSSSSNDDNASEALAAALGM
jgi:hypothetical protein